MRYSLLKTGVAAAALGLIGTVGALAATPFATVNTPKSVDLGSVIGLGGDPKMSVTIALKLSDPTGAETMMARVATQGDALYHQFLTPDQVQAQFGPTEADVNSVMANLSLTGLTVERTSSTTLKATGSISTMERVFQTSLHQFQVAATSTAPAYTH